MKNIIFPNVTQSSFNKRSGSCTHLQPSIVLNAVFDRVHELWQWMRSLESSECGLKNILNQITSTMFLDNIQIDLNYMWAVLKRFQNVTVSPNESSSRGQKVNAKRQDRPVYLNVNFEVDAGRCRSLEEMGRSEGSRNADERVLHWRLFAGADRIASDQLRLLLRHLLHLLSAHQIRGQFSAIVRLEEVH